MICIRKTVVMICCSLSLVINCVSVSHAGSEDLIKGFANYQAGRIENLALDNFIKKISEEKLFKIYFPETSQAVSGYTVGVSGKRLIPLLQYYFDKDIKVLKAVVECIGEKSEDPSSEEAKKLYQITKSGDQILEEIKKFCAIQQDTAVSKSNNKSIKSIITLYNAGKSTKDDDSDKDANNVEKISAAVYVHQLINMIESIGGNTDSTEFNNFKSSALFLANLYELKENGAKPEEFSQTIKDFVNETTVYRNKKAIPGILKNRLFISSYYGFAMNYTDRMNDDEDNVEYRAFGPVGLEFKLYSFGGRPLCVNYAPFDIGAYVTNELKDEEYEADIEDINAPSFFLSFTFRDKPVSILAGYQKNLQTIGGKEDEVAFLSIAFDLPLLTLW